MTEQLASVVPGLSEHISLISVSYSSYALTDFFKIMILTSIHVGGSYESWIELVKAVPLFDFLKNGMNHLLKVNLSKNTIHTTTLETLSGR